MPKLAAKKPAKKMAKKMAAKKPHRRPAAARKILKRPAGYKVLPGTGLLAPIDSVVEPSKMHRGITKARDEINSLIQELIDTTTTDYEIHEIEFAASFSADGKFLGVGVGGAATITFRIRPCN